MKPDDARGFRRVGAWLAAAALLVYAGSAALVPLDNNDIWIHLTTGGLILDEGRVPTTDVYSFTAAGNRYVAHEWLAALYYATAERVSGLTGVEVAAKWLPALALALLLGIAVLATGAPPGLSLPVSLLTFTVLRGRVLARPELLVLPLPVSMLWLLWRDRESARAGHRTRAIYWLMPGEMLWANLHGSFPLGIVLVVLFAFAEAADTWLPGRDSRARWLRGLGMIGGVVFAAWLASLTPVAFALPAAAAVMTAALLFAWPGGDGWFRETSPTGSQGVLRLLALAAGMTASVMLNPLGPEIYAFPFEFTATQNVITDAINEWQPLFDNDNLGNSLQLVVYCSFVALWWATLALGAWRGRLGRLEVAVFFAFAMLPLRHLRWIALFALVTTPALVSLLAHARESAAGDVRGARRVAGVALGAASLASLAVAASFVFTFPPDPWLRVIWMLATATAGVAWLAALRPRLPLWVGTAAAGIAACLLLAIAAGPGIPEMAGVPARAWSGSGTGMGFGPSRQAAPATDFLRERGVEGRLLTEYEWAGYAIHELWPQVTVFIDSRSEVYGESLLRDFQLLKNNEDRARKALAEYGVDLVLLRKRPYPAVNVHNLGLLAALSDDPDWGMVFVDDQSALFARRRPGSGLPEPFHRFEPYRFDPEDPGLADPAVAAEIRQAVERAPHSAFLRFALARSMQRQGRANDAFGDLEAGWAANPHYPALAQLAGEIELAGGRPESARIWFERALALTPGWERAREALRHLDANPR